MIINFSSANKLARASQVSTTLGSSANILLYTGSAPASPDLTTPSTLLCTLPLDNPVATAYYVVQSATVAAGGTGGTTGTQTVSGTTGSGTVFTASVMVSGGAITSVLSILTMGQYTVRPTNANAEPVIGAGLVGATLVLILTAETLINIAGVTGLAVASGTAGFARFATSAGIGVVDLDVGTTGTSIIITSTSIVTGGTISITAASFIEP